MKFLFNVIATTTGMAPAEEMAAIDVFNDALVANGHWILAGGLSSPGDAIVFDNREGAGVVMPGPLVSHVEHIAGFWLIEAPDLEVARALAAEASRACNRKVELRQLLG